MDRRRYGGTRYEGARAMPGGVAAGGGAGAAARQGGPGGVASAQRAATAAARDRHPARVARSDSLVDPRPLARLVDLPLSVAGGGSPPRPANFIQNGWCSNPPGGGVVRMLFCVSSPPPSGRCVVL